MIPQGGSTITGQATELYDAGMKRVARDLDGTATYYVFDGEKIARVEQPEAGTRDFYVQEGQSIYSPLVSVQDESADAQYWYLFDALGSTMGLVDANGNLSGKLQYDAFGNVLAEENVPRSAFFRYVGAYQYMPEEFEDMMLLWHRWYDPTVGMFVGRDRTQMVDAGVYSYPPVPGRGLGAQGLGVIATRRMGRTSTAPRLMQSQSRTHGHGLALVVDDHFVAGFLVGIKFGKQILFRRVCGVLYAFVYTYICLGHFIGAAIGVGTGVGVAWGVGSPEDYEGPFGEIGGSVSSGPFSGGGSVSWWDGTGSAIIGGGFGLSTPEVHLMGCGYQFDFAVRVTE